MNNFRPTLAPSLAGMANHLRLLRGEARGGVSNASHEKISGKKQAVSRPRRLVHPFLSSEEDSENDPKVF